MSRPAADDPESAARIIDDYMTTLAEDWEFCFEEQFKIRAGDGDNIGNNIGIIDWTLFDEQRQLLDVFRRQMRERGFIRVIVDKSRKVGVSTLIQAVGRHACVFIPQTHFWTVSHEAEATQELYDIGARFWENLDPEVRAELPAVVSDKDRVIKWANGSLARCFTQGGPMGAAKGRGATPNILHLSEIPSWELGRKSSSGNDVAQALLNAVPKVPGTIVVLEATARGAVGLFYDTFLSAETREKGQLFESVFFGWQNHADYRISDTASDSRAHRFALSDQLHRAAVADDWDVAYQCGWQLGYTKIQAERAVTFNLDPEQVAFWQQTLVSECQGDPDRFDSEYPLSWEISFIASGKPVFPAQAVKARLDAVLPDADGQGGIQPLQEGTLVRDGAAVRVVQDGGGWAIFKLPVPGHAYLIGGDPAEGSKRKDSDYAAAVVYDRATHEIVATHYEKIYPDELATQMALASLWYNDAELIPERNNHGQACLQHLKDAWESQPVYQRVVGADETKGHFSNLGGFSTDQKTRPLLFDLFARAVRKGECARDPLVIYDPRLLREMMTTIRDATGRPGHARGKHDDLVLATGIVIVVDAEKTRLGVETIVSAPPEPEPDGVQTYRDGRCPPPPGPDDINDDARWCEWA